MCRLRKKHVGTPNPCSGQGHVYHHKFHQNENGDLRGCAMRERDREGEGETNVSSECWIIMKTGAASAH